MTICVIAQNGMRLMPTTNIKKVRKLLKSKRAKIITHEPFTIQLLYKSEMNTQPIEIGVDAGYQTIGVSVKSEKHEFISAEYELLKDETERHHDRGVYRRTRRNRLRYREPRFNNRKVNKKEGWLAPSIENKMQRHIDIIDKLIKYMPITSVTIETAQFDTQLVEAIESGKAVPIGEDYQHGERYFYDTLREAVFSRDNHCCQICKKSAIDDNVILKIHHLGYRKGDRSNRLNNLLTVCDKCHTPKNHKEGGKLYDLKPKLHQYKGVAFMNNVKWQIYNELKEKYIDIDISLTNGVLTKRTRNDRNISKTHANDAYCIGLFFPKHRTPTLYYKKKRRNNRILSKFYDAKYIDTRDGTVKSGQQLSTNRTNRSIPRNNPNNERVFRGQKIREGHFSIRKKHYSLQPHDIVLYNNNKYHVKGIQNKGAYVSLLTDGKPLVVKATMVIPVYRCGGWTLTNNIT